MGPQAVPALTIRQFPIATLVTEQIALDDVTAVYEAMDSFINVGFSVIKSS